MDKHVAYTVGQLANLAGVSTRTLRHYEDQGLLHPQRNASGYRMYTDADGKRLAQILSMKACGLPLTTIRRLFDGIEPDVHASLLAHLRTLRAQGESLDDAIRRTEAAIAALERIDSMSNEDAFTAMKEQGLRDFEETYGKEARERYGDEAVDATNVRLMNLTRDEWDAKELLEESIKVQLRLAMATGDPSSEEAAELTRMHARWLSMHWGKGAYSKEAHRGLAHGYLADERFVAYYDNACGEGATAFLVQCLDFNLA